MYSTSGQTRRISCLQYVKQFYIYYLSYYPFNTVLIPLFSFAQETQSTTDWNIPVETFTQDTLDGSTYIHGKVTIPSAQHDVWSVITDYDEIESFISNVTDAQEISRNGSSIVIYQKGKTRFLIFAKTVEVTLEVQEFSQDSIRFEILEDPFHHYSRQWSLLTLSNAGSVELAYEAVVKPNFFAPRFLVKRVMQNEFRSSLKAIRTETFRRFYQ